MILKTDLLDYQYDAYKKLSKIKVGALYMEMGTGKTRVALGLIKKRVDEKKVDTCLWLCPMSVVNSLAAEIEKHSCDAPIEIVAIETLSASVRENVRLRDLVSSKRVYLIVDESLLVKNHKAKRTENITVLSKSCEYKLILNGTPISKSQKDLYAQWKILDWRILGYRSFWGFAANHIEWDDKYPGKVKRILNPDVLAEKIDPYCYQITKENCISIPRKRYDEIPFYLTREQQEHYKYVYNELFTLVSELEPHTIYRMLTSLQLVTSGYRVDVSARKIKKEKFFKRISENPRIMALGETLESIKGKVIIYCRFNDEIQDISDLLGADATRLYGGVNKKVRYKNIEEFRNEKKYLIANKSCAGFGLNLQFCNNVVYYNNDWDYATRVQSEDRCHRVGQGREVNIIDMYAYNTIDEMILSCIKRKENILKEFRKEIERRKNAESLSR